MSKLYKDKLGLFYCIISEGKIYTQGGNGFDCTASPEFQQLIMDEINSDTFTLIANNYQEKPKCSQPDSLSSSCHASETTAKSRGLLSRICSLFSSNAKK